MSWYLKGEVGKTLDENFRELSELNIQSDELRFESLSEDYFTWAAVTSNAAGAGTIVPDAGQIVSLWKDAERKFIGHVMAPRVASRTISIKVAGPWWWMKRIPLTSDQEDGNGVDAERVNYVFPTGSHKSKIEAALSRGIVNGVPMRLGTVDATFDTPNMSLADMNIAQATAVLMQWLADGVLWFDYTDTSGNGLPIANVSRRDNLPATTYTIGADAVIDRDIFPRLDLEVSYSKIDYVTRNPTTGKPSWATQTAGTLIAGKKQIITVSGPEISDYLPADDFDSYQIQTAATSGAPLAVFVKGADPQLAGTGAATFAVGSGDTYTLLTTYSFASGYQSGASNSQVTAVTSFVDKVGAAVSTAGKYLIITDNLPEWVRRDLGRMFQEVSVIGDAVHEFLLNNNLGTSSPSPPDNALPAWYDGVDFYRTFAGGKSVAARQKWLYSFHRFAVSGVLVDFSWPTLTTLYKPWDYDFLTPPAGLAAGLKAAQDWVPWEGPITLVADEVDAENLIAGKYNLAATLPACSTMNTLAKAVSHSIYNGRTTVTLGAPARADFGTLTSRIRRQPRDNIVNL